MDLERYYQTENEDENPFICSQPRENGMRSCRSVPTLRGEGGGGPPCGLDYEAYNSSSNTTCVNWNQYYTNCSAGEHNPFKGAINFDNIGYAWIAIFQVGLPGHRDVPWNASTRTQSCLGVGGPQGWEGAGASEEIAGGFSHPHQVSLSLCALPRSSRWRAGSTSCTLSWMLIRSTISSTSSSSSS